MSNTLYHIDKHNKRAVCNAKPGNCPKSLPIAHSHNKEFIDRVSDGLNMAQNDFLKENLNVTHLTDEELIGYAQAFLQEEEKWNNQELNLIKTNYLEKAKIVEDLEKSHKYGNLGLYTDSADYYKNNWKDFRNAFKDEDDKKVIDQLSERFPKLEQAFRDSKTEVDFDDNGFKISGPKITDKRKETIQTYLTIMSHTDLAKNYKVMNDNYKKSKINSKDYFIKQNQKHYDEYNNAKSVYDKYNELTKKHFENNKEIVLSEHAHRWSQKLDLPAPVKAKTIKTFRDENGKIKDTYIVASYSVDGKQYNKKIVQLTDVKKEVMYGKDSLGREVIIDNKIYYNSRLDESTELSYHVYTPKNGDRMIDLPTNQIDYS